MLARALCPNQKPRIMRRSLAIGFGVFLSLLAVVIATATVQFICYFDTTYDVNAQTISLAVPAALLALVASVGTALTSLRFIAPRRFSFSRLRHLGAISGVAMACTVGIFAWTVYSVENRPIHSDAAQAAVGQPFELAFTAIDGRPIDIAALKGKVVIVDFWATSCGPCVAELPRIKALYDQWHLRGFEVIGISLDEDKTVLENFVRQRALPWPQYFDGRGWKNTIAKRYKIEAIPQLYLIDKQGRLRDLDGDYDLAVKIERLLAE